MEISLGQAFFTFFTFCPLFSKMFFRCCINIIRFILDFFENCSDFFLFKTQEKKIQVCSSFFFDERRFDNGISTYGLYAIQRLNDYSLFDNYLDEGEIDFRSLFKRQKKFTNPLFKSKFSIERNSIYLENQMYEKSRDVWLAIKQMFGKYVCSWICYFENKKTNHVTRKYKIGSCLIPKLGMQVKVLMQKQHLPTNYLISGTLFSFAGNARRHTSISRFIFEQQFYNDANPKRSPDQIFSFYQYILAC